MDERKNKYSHELQCWTNKSFHCAEPTPEDFTLYETAELGVDAILDGYGHRTAVELYVIENPTILTLHRDRKVLAELFSRYREWVKPHNAACGYEESSFNRGGMGFDMPLLSAALKDPELLEKLPKLINDAPYTYPGKPTPRHNFIPVHVGSYETYKLGKRTPCYKEKKWVEMVDARFYGFSLYKCEVLELFKDIGRVRDRRSTNSSHLKRESTARRRGWDVDRGRVCDIENVDALLSALDSKNRLDECWMADTNQRTIINKELTEEWLDEFIDFYTENVFHDPARARHEIYYGSNQKYYYGFGVRKKGVRGKRSWRKKERRNKKGQFHKDGTYDEDYFIARDKSGKGSWFYR
jgi:hypothetical protein